MLEDNIVIVVDTSNYKASCSEPTPFKAKVKEKLDNEIWVVSIATGKEYELYYSQILEALEIDEIVRMLDMSKYGS